VRAVLIVNPNATSTTAAARDLLAHALESRVHLTVAHTDHRGHATEIARAAARDGMDVVIVHGGDGTVNEVVNGVLGPPAGSDHGHVRWESARTLSKPLTSWSTCWASTAVTSAGGVSG
jgi:diacylglycerol kinase family enzyme